MRCVRRPRTAGAWGPAADQIRSEAPGGGVVVPLPTRPHSPLSLLALFQRTPQSSAPPPHHVCFQRTRGPAAGRGTRHGGNLCGAVGRRGGAAARGVGGTALAPSLSLLAGRDRRAAAAPAVQPVPQRCPRLHAPADWLPGPPGRRSGERAGGGQAHLVILAQLGVQEHGQVLPAGAGRALAVVAVAVKHAEQVAALHAAVSADLDRRNRGGSGRRGRLGCARSPDAQRRRPPARPRQAARCVAGPAALAAGLPG
jgi:hypothetical protein